jgi:hypothetical protein
LAEPETSAASLGIDILSVSDLSERIDVERERVEERRKGSETRQDEPFGWDDYHDLEEIYAFFQELTRNSLSHLT